MLDVKNIAFSYSSHSDRTDFEMRDISFSLEKGEKVALMGANGSGKTTLIRCLNGLLKPLSGSVAADGILLTFPGTLYEIRRLVGMVFQNPDNQIVATSVERELAFGLENIGLPREDMEERIEQAIQKFHLEELRKRPPHLLSGGERQRLAIASVWVMKPGYLILDEPTSLLDPRGREEVLAIIDDQAEKGNMGVLLVTQFPLEAMRCDRLMIMKEGRLVMTGSPDVVFSSVSRVRSAGLDIPATIELDRYINGLVHEHNR